MLGIVKMTVISALASFSLVTFLQPAQPNTVHGKLYVERLPSASVDTATGVTNAARPDLQGAVLNRAAKGSWLSACSGQAWPFYDAGCLSQANNKAASAPVRTITIETREGNTSTLQRVAPTTVARR